MSAIAEALLSAGAAVSGSDRSGSEATERLRAKGAVVSIGHRAENLGQVDLLVYSAAIQADNPERVEAETRGIPQMERSEMLGVLMAEYPVRIGVTGTHGKTTTTSMLDSILHHAGKQPTSLIGGNPVGLGTNARTGSGRIFLTEACEAFASFLELKPSMAVILNVDPDHLDFYHNVEKMEDAFRGFAANVDPDGCIVANADHEGVKRVLAGCDRRIVWFGRSESADYRITDIALNGLHPEYTMCLPGENSITVRLNQPGVQNVIDSAAAAVAAIELGVSPEAARHGLAAFRGVERRFEVLAEMNGLTVIDDYAHHPAEIAATLAATRSASDGRILAVFQPHLFSRTINFLNEFAEALTAADDVVLAPIYPAREEDTGEVSGADVVKKMLDKGFQRARYIGDKVQSVTAQLDAAQPGDVVLVMGAGDIREAADTAIAAYRRSN